MDFKLVLQKLLSNFEKDNIRYALMGGFALGLWGVGRSTVDIDLVINRDDLVKVDRIMRDLGYECKYKTEDVSQYVSPLKIFGEIDLLHAFRPVSLEMLAVAEEREIFGGSLKIRVLKPEDIIGLKLQAVRNNPERQPQDWADIESLIFVNKNRINWQRLEKYFKMIELDDLYKKIKGKYQI